MIVLLCDAAPHQCLSYTSMIQENGTDGTLPGTGPERPQGFLGFHGPETVMATTTIQSTSERPGDLTPLESMEAMIGQMDRLAEEALMQADWEDVKRDAALTAWLRGRGFSRRPKSV